VSQHLNDLHNQNSNLVSLKESQAVEKLTRTTILLAKITILFLPVSLTTAYFSIELYQIDELHPLKAYWLSFLVFRPLTGILLLAFGIMSDRYQGKTVYMSLKGTFLRRWRQKQRVEP
jgi:Mg2+ and Co2+ transporter CorA